MKIFLMAAAVLACTATTQYAQANSYSGKITKIYSATTVELEKKRGVCFEMAPALPRQYACLPDIDPQKPLINFMHAQILAAFTAGKPVIIETPGTCVADSITPACWVDVVQTLQ